MMNGLGMVYLFFVYHLLYFSLATTLTFWTLKVQLQRHFLFVLRRSIQSCNNVFIKMYWWLEWQLCHQNNNSIIWPLMKCVHVCMFQSDMKRSLFIITLCVILTNMQRWKLYYRTVTQGHKKNVFPHRHDLVFCIKACVTKSSLTHLQFIFSSI